MRDVETWISQNEMSLQGQTHFDYTVFGDLSQFWPCSVMTAGGYNEMHTLQ